MAHEFEWDEQKEQINIQGGNPMAHEDEARYKAIGRVGHTLTVLSVIYTERRQIIRIISARLATPREEEEYYYDSDL